MSEEPANWIECGQCGWIGLVIDTKSHVLRPMLDDMLCPNCDTELEFRDQLTETEAKAIIASYDND